MKKFLFIALLLCLMACVAVASAEGLILKDAEGNVLEKGATLSGHYYYKVYVEGVPEEYEGIQTAWMRDVLDQARSAEATPFMIFILCSQLKTPIGSSNRNLSRLPFSM